MKIMKMDIQEVTVSRRDLEEVFTQWAKEAAAKIAQERANEEMMERYKESTCPANVDRSMSTLMNWCEEDPKRVGEWFAKWFLKIVAGLERELREEDE